MSVEETIKEIAARILHKPDINFSDNVTFKDLGADSLDIVQMLVAIEDKYDIELVDEEMQAITNTREFVDYIERKIAEKG
jgi:acyl carrier protein